MLCQIFYGGIILLTNPCYMHFSIFHSHCIYFYLTHKVHFQKKLNIHETSGILWEKNIILFEELCFYSNQDSIVLIYDFSTLLITKTVFQNIFSSLLHSEQHLLKLWPNTTNWCLIVIKILHTQTNNSSLVYIKHTQYL